MTNVNFTRLAGLLDFGLGSKYFQLGAQLATRLFWISLIIFSQAGRKAGIYMLSCRMPSLVTLISHLGGIGTSSAGLQVQVSLQRLVSFFFSTEINMCVDWVRELLHRQGVTDRQTDMANKNSPMAIQPKGRNNKITGTLNRNMEQNMMIVDQLTICKNCCKFQNVEKLLIYSPARLVADPDL